jgi:hypothetical protein
MAGIEIKKRYTFIHIVVLQVTTLCSLGGTYQYFEGNWCLHLQGRNFYITVLTVLEILVQVAIRKVSSKCSGIK